MDRRTRTERVAKKYMKEMAQSVLDILEADDGRTYEEKKAEAIKILSKEQKSMMCIKKISNKKISNEEKETEIVTRFWSHGEIKSVSNGIILRQVDECDKEKFIELQKENAILPAMFRQEDFQNDLWQEHIADTALMCSIILRDEYVGYYGIKNVAHDKWEIAIAEKF